MLPFYAYGTIAPGEKASAKRNRISTAHTHQAPQTTGSDDLVLRPLLLERLNRGLDRKLTLVSAIGAIVYVLLYHWRVGGPVGLLACIAVTSAIRMM